MSVLGNVFAPKGACKNDVQRGEIHNHKKAMNRIALEHWHKSLTCIKLLYRFRICWIIIWRFSNHFINLPHGHEDLDLSNSSSNRPFVNREKPWCSYLMKSTKYSKYNISRSTAIHMSRLQMMWTVYLHHQGTSTFQPLKTVDPKMLGKRPSKDAYFCFLCLCCVFDFLSLVFNESWLWLKGPCIIFGIQNWNSSLWMMRGVNHECTNEFFNHARWRSFISQFWDGICELRQIENESIKIKISNWHVVWYLHWYW